MNYHNITKCDMKNGPGLRVVLWVSGCSHRCRGCHNKITWDPRSGILFDNDAKIEVLEELHKEYCDGITISGGDPLYPGNRDDVYELIKVIKFKYPNKSIWIYTGYTWEELIEEAQVISLKSPLIAEILKHTDVLVDGEFNIELADQNYRWAGSKNQRVIDVQESIKQGGIVFYESN